MKNDIAAYLGCISGVVLLEEYQSLLKDANLTSKFNIFISISWKILTFPLQDVTIVDTERDFRVYERIRGGTMDASIPAAPGPGSIGWKATYDINEWVGECLFFP